MPVAKPYPRTRRIFSSGNYKGSDKYIRDPRYASSPEHYVRAFLLIQKDLLELLDYVEPADKNDECYSYRIHALLLRTCVEVEANFRAILSENEYTRKDGRWWNMSDYQKVDATHLLSSYWVKIPNWSGSKGEIRFPFLPWKNNERLSWYDAYNATKHDRHGAFPQATFKHLVDAVCGLLVILSAQFGPNDFVSGDYLVAWPFGGTEPAVGGYFGVAYPYAEWPEDMRYEFDWDSLKSDPQPFQKIDYSKI